MSAWSFDLKASLRCPRCGAASSETSVLCEPHRIANAEWQARYKARMREARAT